MGGRNLHFKGCEFRNNAAKFAGALRINDIGDALIEDSLSVPPIFLFFKGLKKCLTFSLCKHKQLLVRRTSWYFTRMILSNSEFFR